MDEDVPVGKGREFTIVVSRPEDRPRNARAACPENGDGVGHTDDGRLLLRNMLPAGDLAQAIQNTRTGDDEQQVMGPYLPSGTYTSTHGFERQGCDGSQTARTRG